MAEYGIEDLEPDEYYPQKAELNALQLITMVLEPHSIDRLGE